LPQSRGIHAAVAFVLGATCAALLESSLVQTSLGSFTAATANLPVRRRIEKLNSEEPYTSPSATAQSPANPSGPRVVARVAGIALLSISLFPFAATIFLLNQELQIIPLEFELVGISGPGIGESHLSMRSLLVLLACMTGIAWAIGLYLVFVLGKPSSYQRC
jgi:hypothetical protein